MQLQYISWALQSKTTKNFVDTVPVCKPRKAIDANYEFLPNNLGQRTINDKDLKLFLPMQTFGTAVKVTNTVTVSMG
jgi:hypothetical protein